MRVATGDASRYCYFAAVDVTDLKTPETGLTGFTVAHSVAGGGDVGWTTPTTAEVDATVAPGLYALLMDELPAITSGVDEQEVALIISHASMRTVFRTVELYRPKLTAGQTATVTGGLVSANSTQIDGEAPDDWADANFERNVPDEPSDSGTAQGGGSNYIDLASSASSTDNFYNGHWVILRSGTGGGNVQAGFVTDYVGASRRAYIDHDWITQPDNTTVYSVYADAGNYPGDVSDLATATALQTVDDEIATMDGLVDQLITALVSNLNEPAAIPAANAPLYQKLNFAATVARNKITQTATTQTLFADDGTTEIGTATVSDDATTATRSEWS